MNKNKFDREAYQQAISAKLEYYSECENLLTVSLLGVQVNHENWLVALDELEEVLPVAEITRVPHTQLWLKGLVNVRGNLYALTDLAHYFGHPLEKITEESRMLLVHTKYGINAVLLVDKLLGLRNLNALQAVTDCSLQTINSQCQYRDSDQQLWSVLNIGQLLGESKFMQVATI